MTFLSIDHNLGDATQNFGSKGSKMNEAARKAAEKSAWDCLSVLKSDPSKYIPKITGTLQRGHDVKPMPYGGDVICRVVYWVCVMLGSPCPHGSTRSPNRYDLRAIDYLKSTGKLQQNGKDAVASVWHF